MPTIAGLTAATACTDADLLWINQGSGSDRDKSATIAKIMEAGATQILAVIAAAHPTEAIARTGAGGFRWNNAESSGSKTDPYASGSPVSSVSLYKGDGYPYVGRIDWSGSIQKSVVVGSLFNVEVVISTPPTGILADIVAHAPDAVAVPCVLVGDSPFEHYAQVCLFQVVTGILSATITNVDGSVLPWWDFLTKFSGSTTIRLDLSIPFSLMDAP